MERSTSFQTVESRTPLMLLQDLLLEFMEKNASMRIYNEKLDKAIIDLRSRIQSTTKEMGGAYTPAKTRKTGHKYVATMENRLGRTQVELNKTMVACKHLRADVDWLRTERTQFREVCRRKERDTKEHEYKIAEYRTEIAAFREERDDVKERIQMMHKVWQEELAEYEEEKYNLNEERKRLDVDEFNRHARRFSVLQNNVNEKFQKKAPSADEEALLQAKRLQVLEDDLRVLLQAEAVGTVDDLIRKYKDNESDIFTLFTYADEQAAETENLSNEKEALQRELDQLMREQRDAASGAQGDARKSEAKFAEHRETAKLEERAHVFNKRFDEVQETLEETNQMITRMLSKLGLDINADHDVQGELQLMGPLVEANMIEYLAVVEKRVLELLDSSTLNPQGRPSDEPVILTPAPAPAPASALSSPLDGAGASASPVSVRGRLHLSASMRSMSSVRNLPPTSRRRPMTYKITPPIIEWDKQLIQREEREEAVLHDKEQRMEESIMLEMLEEQELRSLEKRAQDLARAESPLKKSGSAPQSRQPAAKKSSLSLSLSHSASAPAMNMNLRRDLSRSTTPAIWTDLADAVPIIGLAHSPTLERRFTTTPDPFKDPFGDHAPSNMMRPILHMSPDVLASSVEVTDGEGRVIVGGAHHPEASESDEERNTNLASLSHRSLVRTASFLMPQGRKTKVTKKPARRPVNVAHGAGGGGRPSLMASSSSSLLISSRRDSLEDGQTLPAINTGSLPLCPPPPPPPALWDTTTGHHANVNVNADSHGDFSLVQLLQSTEALLNKSLESYQPLCPDRDDNSDAGVAPAPRPVAAKQSTWVAHRSVSFHNSVGSGSVPPVATAAAEQQIPSPSLPPPPANDQQPFAPTLAHAATANTWPDPSYAGDVEDDSEPQQQQAKIGKSTSSMVSHSEAGATQWSGSGSGSEHLGELETLRRQLSAPVETVSDETRALWGLLVGDGRNAGPSLLARTGPRIASEIATHIYMQRQSTNLSAIAIPTRSSSESGSAPLGNRGGGGGGGRQGKPPYIYGPTSQGRKLTNTHTEHLPKLSGRPR